MYGAGLPTSKCGVIPGDPSALGSGQLRISCTPQNLTGAAGDVRVSDSVGQGDDVVF